MESVAFDGEPDHHSQQEKGLDTEFYNVGQHCSQGYYEPREIDLAKDGGVGHEGVGGSHQAGTEVIPEGNAAEIKQDRLNAIGGETGEFAKEHQENTRRQHGLDEMPERAQDRLLVLGSEVAPDKKKEQVAVVPHLPEVEDKKTFPGLQDQIPILFSCRAELTNEGRLHVVFDRFILFHSCFCS